MKKLKVALDVDGVILDFYKAVCERKGRLVSQTDTWDIDWIYSSLKSLSQNSLSSRMFWRSIQPLVDPQSISFDFDIYLTSIPKIFRSERELNLTQLGFPNRPVIVEHDKLRYCIDSNIDVLIDDRPKTVKQFVNVGKHIIQYIPYHAEWEEVDGALVARNMKGISSHLDNLRKIT